MSATDTVTGSSRAKKTKTATPSPPATLDSEHAAMRTLELVFFVHLQMAEIADQVLMEQGLGRPHHRVLHFAGRSPGITVGSLMSLLRISNQALSRTTSQLTSKGLLEQRYSPEDRRVRQNHLTPKGHALLRVLTERQLALIAKAQKKLSASEIEGMWKALTVMVRPEDLAWVTMHPFEL